jgi:hypothetical protein
LTQPKNKQKPILLFLLIGIITLGGCTEVYKAVESDFIIKVSGTKDLKFNGHYSFVAAGSTPIPVNMVGTVPTEYPGKGVMALCLFRKTTLEGSLKVEILQGEKVVAEGEAVVPYGVVSLKTPVPGKDNIIMQILKKFVG